MTSNSSIELGLNPPQPKPRIQVKSSAPEVSMRSYEFLCHNCKKLFSKMLSLADYEDGDVLCPHCGSKEVEQCRSAFSALTSKNRAS
jgi:putative FmdB family regulatory protein